MSEIKKEQISNYKKLCDKWAGKFLCMDKEKLMQRLPELKREEEYLRITHFGIVYGISLTDGRIRFMEREEEPDVTAMLNIYTLLEYARETAVFMDKWVPFRELRGAGPFAPAYKLGVTDVFAQTFSGQADKLRSACESMGGIRLPQGDVGYEIRAFSCMPLRFYFWDKDEEFAAQGNILFDYSATDYNHVESAVTVAEEGIRRLAEAAGVPVRGKSFGMK